MDSAVSTGSSGSAMQHYSPYQRSPSLAYSLSRSDSGGSCSGMDRAKRIQEGVRIFEIVSWIQCT